MALATALLGCSDGEAVAAAAAPVTAAGIAPQKVADMLHAVMEADRVVYTKQVVNRLVQEQSVQIVNPETKQAESFGASEQWKTEHGKLPLPAQNFRMGAEAVSKKNVGVSYTLLSQWPVNKQNEPKTEAADLFYDRLFAIDPKLRPLFPEDLSEQKKKLMSMIARVVSALRNVDSMVPAIADLGRRHLGYGVTDADYGTVAAALLWTLEQGLGAAWTPQVEESWTAAYTLLSSVMMDAAKQPALARARRGSDGRPTPAENAERRPGSR